MTRARFVVPVVAFALMTACSILPKAETPRTYTLPAAPGARPAAATPVSWALRVASPSAPRALDNARIAVVPESNQITVYAGARWADSSPHLFRDRLADAYRDSGRFPAVSTDDANLGADVEVGGTLTAFQTEYVNGKPEVVVRFDAIAANTRKHAIISTQRFEVHEPVNGKEVPQVVEAFGRAMDKVSRDVVTWTIQAVPAKP